MAGNLQFVSWSRRGVGAGTPAGQLGSRRTVTTSVQVSVARQGQAPPPPVTVPSAPMAVLGPGDVVGVTPDQVVRRTPRPDTHNLEPNYLASIEFAHPDLPWLFSPAAASGEKLQPWLMLAVVDRTQMSLSTRPGSPNPVLVLSDPAALPDPERAWAWAHVQVHDTDAAGATAAVRGSQPVAANIRSRLLCPTRLGPDRDYLAVVLPTYEAGRRVGIGDDEADAGTAFWQATAGLVLPVYDSWRFRTGPSGDFETLARKLHGVTGAALERLGERRVTVESRASLMQADDRAPELFGSVVHHIGTAIAKDDRPSALSPDSPAPDAQADAFHRRLKELVDIVASAGDDAPIVGPPLYGRWPAVVTSLDGAPEQADLADVPAGTSQTWIEQLNADPYLRIAAGVATQVVQRDQETLMTDAWSQLSDVLSANARMRWARTYAEAATVVHTRLAGATPASALRVTAPAFGRVRADAEQTVRASVDTTTLPREVLGATFLKVAQYAVGAGATGAVTTPVTATLTEAVTQIGTSAAAVLPTRFTTPRALDPAELGGVLEQGDLAARVQAGVGTDPATYLDRIKQLPREITRIAGRFQDVDHRDGGVRITISKAQARRFGDVVNRISPHTPAEELVEHPDRPRQVPARPGPVLTTPLADELAALPGTTAPAVSLQALAAIKQLIQTQGTDEPDGVEVIDKRAAAVDLTGTGVHIEVSSRLHPDVAVLTDAVGLGTAPAKVFDARQTLRTAALANLGLDAPSISDVLGQIDVESAGPLHRGYDDVIDRAIPIDATLQPPPLVAFDPGTKNVMVEALEPRAAYSRMLSYAHQGISDAVVRRPGSQFHPAMASPRFPQPLVDRLKSLDEDWVLGGVKDMPANSVCVLAVNWRFVESFLAGANHEMARELLWRGYPTDLRGTCFSRFWSPAPDIASMDRWTGPIPEHGATPGQRHELTMVVIKGDLLRRYPSTLISAEKGTASADADDPQFASDDEIAGEVFRGFLGDDVTYVALDVPIERLRTEVDPRNRRHCWYISLLEPHDEPRFGLDEPDGPAPGTNQMPHGDYSITDDWMWQGLRPPVLAGSHLLPQSVYAEDSSAVVGASLFQRPFRLLLRAPDYLPAE